MIPVVNSLTPSEITFYAVGYLERDLDSPWRLCAEIASDLLEVMGSCKVRAYLTGWRRDQPRTAPPGRHPVPETIDPGRKRHDLAKLLESRQSTDDSIEVVCAFLEAPPPSGSTEAPDQLFRIEYAIAGHVQLAHMHARVHLGLNAALLELMSPDQLWDLLHRFFARLDATGQCFYGLVDVAAADEIRGGMYYGDHPLRPFSWHRSIEHYEWLLLGDERLNHVRGTYWGTYLGPAMAKRVDGEGTFLERYLAYIRSGIHRAQKGERLSKGGIFVTVSENPMDMFHPVLGPVEWCWENALWLRQEFRKAGLLLS